MNYCSYLYNKGTKKSQNHYGIYVLIGGASIQTRNPILHCVSTHFPTWENCIRCICMYLHNKTMQLGGTKGMSNTYTQITKKRKMIFRKQRVVWCFDSRYKGM